MSNNDERLDLIEERLKFIEAQFGIEFVPPHEVGPSYKKIQKDSKEDELRNSEHRESGESPNESS